MYLAIEYITSYEWIVLLLWAIKGSNWFEFKKKQKTKWLCCSV